MEVLKKKGRERNEKKSRWVRAQEGRKKGRKKENKENGK